MVSAWSSANNLVLGQVKVDEKSNEITAIPELIENLAIEGAVITTDAMGCQKKIAKSIVDKKADYVFGLKKIKQICWKKLQMNLGFHLHTRLGR